MNKTKFQTKHIGIIGGGIAGLYAARQLLRNGYEVTIFEKNKDLGGRVCTAYKDDISYEGGAGRFHSGHRRLMKLLKEYNLHNEVVPNQKQRLFMKDGKAVDYDLNSRIEKLVKHGAQKSKTYLQQRTLLAFMFEVMSPSEVEDMIHAFGYVSEFDTCNAYDSLRVFQKEFRDTIDYFSLKGGLSTLIEALKRELTSSTVLTATIVDNIQRRNGVTYVYAGKQQWTFDACIICVTRNALKNMKGVQSNPHVQDLIATSISRPLHRIYAQFPTTKGKSWFTNLPRITTNNLLGYIIPINAAHGIIMISYTDGQIARLWNYLRKNDVLQSSIMMHLRQLFPKRTIPEPLWVDSWYWDEGAHYWQLTKSNAYKKYVPTKEELESFGYVLGGEVVSPNHQAWIEGALESIDIALKVLILQA